MSFATVALPVPTVGAPAATPRWSHDCGHCRFIGHVDVHGEAARDVYLCPNGGYEEVVLRNGHAGGDMAALPASIVERNTAGLGWHYELAGLLLFGLRAGRFDTPPASRPPLLGSRADRIVQG